MNKIIEELWYGNICPDISCHNSTVDAKELVEYISRHKEKLLCNLDDDQKETLEKLDDCYTELIDINERKTFMYAFRLGAKIAISVMEAENE